MIARFRSWLARWVIPALVEELKITEQARLAALASALMWQTFARELKKEILAGAPGLGLREWGRIQEAERRTLAHVRGEGNGDGEPYSTIRTSG